MKKYLFLSLILGLLIFIGCDRFEHNFEPDVNNIFVSEFFNDFATELSNISQASLPTVMSFYDEAYNNNGLTKTNIEAYFQDLINDGLTLSATIIDTTSLPQISWNLIGDDGTDAIVVDEDFDDVLVLVEDSYKFYGNQADMRNVVVELFTGQWCSNCPNAEDALHNLKQQYGSRFSYVEYHFGNDELVLENSPISYYPFFGTLPFGIVNGNEHLIYTAPSVEEVQAEIETAILPLLQEPLLVNLSNVQTTLTDTLLSGTVQIELDQSVPTTDLALVAVLMEDFNDEYLNYHGEPHHNIAIKRATFDISTANLQNPIEFSITDLETLPTWYMNNSTGLPADLTLVIWVQTLESPYNGNTCAVHNVIEIPLYNN